MPTYRDIVEVFERRGQYREADAVRFECSDLDREAGYYDPHFDLLTRSTIEATERVLREEF